MRTINFQWFAIESINKQNSRNQFCPSTSVQDNKIESESVCYALKSEKKQLLVNDVGSPLYTSPHISTIGVCATFYQFETRFRWIDFQSILLEYTHTHTDSAASEWLFFSFDERADGRHMLPFFFFCWCKHKYLVFVSKLEDRSRERERETVNILAYQYFIVR